MDKEFGGTSLISEHGLDLSLVCRLRHVDGKSVSKLFSEYLILGTGNHLHSGNVPRNWNLLVAYAALEDGVLALDDFDVFQRLRELELLARVKHNKNVIGDHEHGMMNIRGGSSPKNLGRALRQWPTIPFITESILSGLRNRKNTKSIKAYIFQLAF